MLGLEQLTAIVHRAEDCFDTLRSGAERTPDRALLLARAGQRARGASPSYARHCRTQAVTVTSSKDRKHERAVTEIAGRLDAHKSGELSANAALDAIERAVLSRARSAVV